MREGQGQQRSGRPQEVPALTEIILMCLLISTDHISLLAFSYSYSTDAHTLVRAASSRPGSASARAVASNSSWVARPDLPLQEKSGITISTPRSKCSFYLGSELDLVRAFDKRKLSDDVRALIRFSG